MPRSAHHSLSRSEGCELYIAFLMFVIQMEKNVTVPSPENCTSPSLCWTDGLYTWTMKNISHKENIAKCEWTSCSISPWDGPSGLFVICGAPVSEGRKGHEGY